MRLRRQAADFWARHAEQLQKITTDVVASMLYRELFAEASFCTTFDPARDATQRLVRMVGNAWHARIDSIPQDCPLITPAIRSVLFNCTPGLITANSARWCHLAHLCPHCYYRRVYDLYVQLRENPVLAGMIVRKVTRPLHGQIGTVIDAMRAEWKVAATRAAGLIASWTLYPAQDPTELTLREHALFVQPSGYLSLPWDVNDTVTIKNTGRVHRRTLMRMLVRIQPYPDTIMTGTVEQFLMSYDWQKQIRSGDRFGFARKMLKPSHRVRANLRPPNIITFDGTDAENPPMRWPPVPLAPLQTVKEAIENHNPKAPRRRRRNVDSDQTNDDGGM